MGNLAEKYLSYLKEEGFVPSMDEDGDITFKVEGKLYFFLIDDEDDRYYKLVFPNFWSVDDESEREKITHACLHAARSVKVVKMYTVRDNTWAVIEMFLASTDDIGAVFPRSLRALQAGVQSFVEKMRE